MSDTFSRVSSSTTLAAALSHTSCDKSSPKGCSDKDFAQPPITQSPASSLPDPPTYPPSYLPGAFFFMSFASHGDLFWYLVGILCALIAGVGFIGLDLLYGIWSDAVNGSDRDEISRSALLAVLGSIGIAVGMVVFCSAFLYILSVTSENICARMQSEYFNRVLHQDVTYVQQHGSGEVATRMIKDINTIQTGIGEKAGFVFWAFGTLISGVVTAFTKNAQLAGVQLSSIAALFIFLGVSYAVFDNVSALLFKYEGQKNSYIEQIFANVRVVQAFAAENFVVRGYNAYHARLQRLGFHKSISSGLELSIMYLALTGSYPLAFGYGAHGVFEQNKPINTLVVPFYNILNALFAISNILPHVSGLLQSVSVQRHLRSEMLRMPLVDVTSSEGLKLTTSNWDASIELRNVSFAYPNAPDSEVLHDVSFSCPPGKTTAIVGGSGAGKSTIPALLLREYNLVAKNTEEKESSGIFLAGHDLNSLNIKWLRSQYAVVSQDPQLLSGTVWENVAHGLSGTPWEYQSDRDETNSERKRVIKQLCHDALVKADAIDFVKVLPHGMDTQLSGGTGLSGGQTQRIAIARALVRRPRLLIFDEGTSALDTATETRVKVNLDAEQKARQMTVIVIAHRLSTVQDADNIVVMSNGYMVEQGTHDSLVKAHGYYHRLVGNQQVDGTPSGPGKKTYAGQNESSLDTIQEGRASSFGSAVSPRAVMPIGYQSDSRTFTPLARTTSLTSLEAGEAAKELAGKPPPFFKVVKVFVKQSWVQVFTGIVCAIIVGSSFDIDAWLIGETVQIVGSHVPGSTDPNYEDILRWIWYFVIVFAITTATAFTGGLAFEWTASRIRGGMTDSVVKHLLRQETYFFDTNPSGSLATSIASHAAHVGEGFGLVLCQLIITSSNLLGAVILVFILSWKLSVVILCPVLVLFLTGYLETMSFEQLHANRQPLVDQMSGFTNEHIDAFRTVSLFGRQLEVLKNFNSISNQRKTSASKLLLGCVCFAASQGAIVILGGLSLWWGAQLLLREEASVSTLFASYESALIAGFAASRMLAFLPDITRAVGSAKAIGSWLERESRLRKPGEEEADYEGSRNRHSKGNENIILQYDDVSFRYPHRPEKAVLRHVSFSISEGQSVAFVGASGSGKTTAMQLLLRLYDPGRGRVSLDGKDIRQYNLPSLRSTMALVPQSSVLFEGTLRENIAFGLQNISDEKIMEACAAANIVEMVDTLPDGLDTLVNLKGSTFSGGQKQRIAIARAVLRKPRILLLDEATSALDSNSEAAVQEALNEASKERTTVTIAHRLRTIKDSDVIFVFEEGRIVESGNHDQLMAAKSKYFDLVQAQV